MKTNQAQPKIRLITLSTCFFCAKVRAMLEQAGLQYSVTDIDLLPDDIRQEQLERIRRFNPAEAFPIVIIGDKAIVGYQEQRIREELRLT